MATINLSDLKGPEGKDNTPGLKGRAFFAPEHYFEANGIVGVGADGVTIAGPHVFKSGEGFHELYITLDSNELKMETTGERDGRGKSVTLEFFHPGNSVEVAQFDRVVKNTSGILLIETPDGEVIQVGSAGLGTEITGAFTSGKLSGGRRGWTFTAQAYQNGMQFYSGAIALKRDAVVV
jgi:hypothetical protein